ncbi:MAG: diol dehydratase small subunit [Chloroflexi bacterium]|nr:diol dehydratase small subunit [Chloroflexota bacterium]MCC6897120.1 diol dehydratase small subunit [Anaerolineae bacterium]
MSDPKYPLMQNAADQLRALSGRSLSEITLDAAASGSLTADDIRIQADTLRQQAEVAEQAGYVQLGANLRRAAELTAVPNNEVLQIYELLRPGRASYTQLIQLAEHLETTYQATVTGGFIREAAEVYKQRSLLR